jgi:hypothetical protein
VILRFCSVKKSRDLARPILAASRGGLSLVLLCPYNQPMAICIGALTPIPRRRIPE